MSFVLNKQLHSPELHCHFYDCKNRAKFSNFLKLGSLWPVAAGPKCTWGIGVQCDCYYWHTTATTKDAMKEREDTTDAAYRSAIPSITYVRRTQFYTVVFVYLFVV